MLGSFPDLAGSPEGASIPAASLLLVLRILTHRYPLEVHLSRAVSHDRAYVNHHAQEEFRWSPRSDFRHVLDRLQRGENVFGILARAVGSKGCHPRNLEDGPYPIESSE